MPSRLRPLPAGFVVLCLPTRAPRPPYGAIWLHEIKHDGFRVIARKEGKRVRLYIRPGNDLTHWGIRLRASTTGGAENLQPMSSKLAGALEMLSQQPDVPAIGTESHVKGIAEERHRADDFLSGHIGEHAQEQVARYA